MGDYGSHEGIEASPVDLDVVVVGAGISGINAAYRIQDGCPDKTYAVFEARDSLGGTWDLFKYPGIRSDSDLHTFGFSWRPWTYSKTIAEGPLIKQYMTECAQEYGIDKHIRYRHKLSSANWSTSAQAWSLKVDVDGESKTITCRFLFLGTGYYDYKQPLKADIPGLDNFKGKIIHPQFWPEDLDYKGKEIVIIGSGATAVTLLPNLAEKASKVTMLQRSPGYILSLPQVDKLSQFMKRFLPLSLVAKITRLRFIVFPFLFFQFCRTFPNAARNLLQKGAKSQLPKDYPMKPNFDPAYNPWEQRLCVCPSGDFYKAIGTSKCDVLTGHIDTITEKSIIMKDSGIVLHPDIIITATGLKIQMGGGAKISVDGSPVIFSDKHLWKASLIQDVPNCSVAIGYTNASWTLGADATSRQFVRIINNMKANGKTSVTPKIAPGEDVGSQGVLNLNSTYILKAAGELPKSGTQKPWLPRSGYMFDTWEASYGSITSGLVYT